MLNLTKARRVNVRARGAVFVREFGCQTAMRQRPCCLVGAGCALSFLCPPAIADGDGAPDGAGRGPRLAAWAAPAGAARLPALRGGDFCPRRRASGREWLGHLSTPPPAGFRPPSLPPTSSHSRQPVDSAGGRLGRGLPSPCLRGRAAGAASGPTIKTPHDSALRRTELWLYSPIGIFCQAVFTPSLRGGAAAEAIQSRTDRLDCFGTPSARLAMTERP
jgi:hypothetical protein